MNAAYLRDGLGVSLPTAHEDVFTIYTTGAPIMMRRVAAVWCGAIRANILETNADHAAVPFDEERTGCVIALAEALAESSIPFACRRLKCERFLRMPESTALMEVVLFLDHAELLRVLQDSMASALTGLSANQVCERFGIAPDLSSVDAPTSRREPLLMRCSQPAPCPPSTDLLSISLVTEDAALASIGRCSAETLHTLLKVSRAWAARARLVAVSAEWLEHQVLDDGAQRTVDISWTLRHALECSDDLTELLRRLPDNVTQLRAFGKQVVLAPILQARVLDVRLLWGCVSEVAGADGKDEDGDGYEELQDEDEDDEDEEGVADDVGGCRDRRDRTLRLVHAAALHAMFRSRELQELGDGVFAGCHFVREMAPPLGLTTISGGGGPMGRGAFESCRLLACVRLPASLTTVDAGAFWGCDTLTKLLLPAMLTQIGNHAFHDCTSLAAVELPIALTAIGRGAFSGCASLVEITIHAGLARLEQGAFSHCTSLSRVCICAALRSIAEGAFCGCTALHTISLPIELTLIDNAAFQDCISLSQVVFPRRLTAIGVCAFSGCASLTRVVLPSGLTTLGRRAFADCASLATATRSDGATLDAQALQLDMPEIVLNSA